MSSLTTGQFNPLLHPTDQYNLHVYCVSISIAAGGMGECFCYSDDTHSCDLATILLAT